MAYCTKCGAQLQNDACFCASCGEAVGNTVNANRTPVDEGPTFGWGVLGFFIPLVGLILYLIWMKDYPKRSKSAGIGALISVASAVALYIFLIVLMVVFAIGIPAAAVAW